MKFKLFVILFSIFFTLNSIAQKDTLSGKITKVHDGDTFTFKTNNDSIITVRMKNIDAPELSQPYVVEYRKFLLIYLGKYSKVVIYSHDKYNRALGVLFVSSTCVNLNMVKTGNAWNYITYNKDVKYQLAQTRAHKLKRGLWSLENPIAPSDWRKAHPLPGH